LLQNLYIKNYILISELNLEINSGFTSITGETGAGKSILLGALSLLTGSRTDISVLLNKDQKCIVEGIFNLENYNLENIFTELDIDYNKNTIIRREINQNGNSRAFINDSPVNISTLKILGENLIDIHSQHNNLLLKDNNFYLQILDSYSKNTNLVNDYKNQHKELKRTEKQLAELIETSNKNKQDIDYFQFRFNQINDANLLSTEQEELEQELKKITNAEEIKEKLLKINYELIENEENIIIKLKELTNTFLALNKLGIEQNFAQRIETSIIELKDISLDCDKINSEIIFDPKKSEEINKRLNLIYDLQHKFSAKSITELLSIKDELNLKLQTIDNNDKELLKLQKEVNIQIEQLLEKAKTISKNRKSVISEIEKTINSDLIKLGIPNSNFKIIIEQLEKFNETGLDKAIFLFSANKNIAPDKLSNTASGGELSRIMLALKSMLANSNNLPTIIFDEIDTGISGEIASKMAEIMLKLAKNTQVLSITHLPQIAAKGSKHLLVYKNDNNSKTQTNIKYIENNELINEIAKMLSGKNITPAAIENAKDLIKTKNN
jgi:DNA repair protein RecN (Recombination protein N)